LVNWHRDLLFAMDDGIMLELGIKPMRDKKLLMPARLADRPNRDRPAARFKLYQTAN